MNIYLNQRGCERKEYETLISYSGQMEGQYIDGTMIDCAMDGICFISDFPYLPKTDLFIKIGKDDAPSSAEVKWSRPLFGNKQVNNYQVGVQFTDPV
jgi:hypothetical protein